MNTAAHAATKLGGLTPPEGAWIGASSLVELGRASTECSALFPISDAPARSRASPWAGPAATFFQRRCGAGPDSLHRPRVPLVSRA